MSRKYSPSRYALTSSLDKTGVIYTIMLFSSNFDLIIRMSLWKSRLIRLDNFFFNLLLSSFYNISRIVTSFLHSSEKCRISLSATAVVPFVSRLVVLWIQRRSPVYLRFRLSSFEKLLLFYNPEPDWSFFNLFHLPQNCSSMKYVSFILLVNVNPRDGHTSKTS